MLVLILAALAEDSIATVNGVPIPTEDLERTLASLPENVRNQVDDAQILDRLVLTELLVQAAQKSGADKGPEAEAQLRLSQRSTIAQLQLEHVLDERIDNAAVKAWYDEHRAQFAVREARARHILVPTEDEAKGVMASLKKGQSFEALAAAQSTDPGSAKTGGELGWFTQDRMVPQFAAAVFGAKAGQVIGPVQTQFGWHVIEVEELRDAIPLEEATPDIRAQLRNELTGRYLDELKLTAAITTALPPDEPTLTALTVVPDVPTDAPRAGKGKRAVLQVFLDAECPHCARSEPELVALANQRADLTVVFRHYPLSSQCNAGIDGERHVNACAAARAVVCAGKKNLAVLGGLMTNSAVLSDEVIANVAAENGLKGKAWDACLAAPATADRVAADVQMAEKLGVGGTPSLYLGAGGTWWHYEGSVEDLPGVLDKLPTK